MRLPDAIRGFVSVLSLPSLAWAASPGGSPTPSAPSYKSEALTAKGLFTKGIEGPSVNSGGELFVVNFKKQGTIGRISSDGEVSLFLELPAGSVASGLRFGANGDLFIADYKAHTVYVLRTGSSKPEIHVREPRMSQPNDIVVAKDGVIWATDPDWKRKSGRIWKISVEKKTEIAADKLGLVNGIDLSPDENTLYVSDSKDRSIYAFPIESGRLGSKRLIKRFPDASVDGLKTDANGDIYVARIEKGSVAKVSPKGEVLREIPLLGRNPTNLAFGGPDGRTIFVTQMDGGFVETFRAEAPGREFVKMFSK